MLKIAVIGTGYVGLVTGTCFAETGNQVICVDVDEQKVNSLRNEIIPIFEPGLELYFHRNIEQGRLSFTTDFAKAIRESQVIFFCLPTPPGEDGSADLSYVTNAAHDLGKILDEYKIVVNKSTVPVGTANRVSEVLSSYVSEDLFDVVSNPEFLREGAAVEDFMKPERVVVGTGSKKAQQIIKALYTPFVRQGNPIIFMDERSAELTKYAANAFLATKISFMNEMANLCDRLGANIDWVRKGIGSDSRIGKRFLFPGIGYGGSCFPKDVQALKKTADEQDYKFRILDAVMRVNSEQKIMLAKEIEAYFGYDLRDKTIAIWGLSFKPNTDDIREAPSLYIIAHLIKAGAKIQAYDPEAMDNFKKEFPENVTYCKNQYEALNGADALAILTEWNLFRAPDYSQMKGKLIKDLIFDGRNVYDLEVMKKYEFEYYSIGRPVLNQILHH